MEPLLEKIKHLNALVLQGKTLEAFDTYYHDSVVMQENDKAPTIGKAANRQRELDFMEAVVEIRQAQVVKVCAGENTTMVEWAYDFTHRDWGKRTYTQVSVQEWQDGQIIREKFYYGG